MKSRLPLLIDKFFILGLFCLLTNDLILKYQFGGFVTGKLSDIAGLFIFPFFWSVFFVRHELKIYLLTILIFVIWKAPLSTNLINWINHTLGTEFSRVVDYTDLVALFILPISYLHFRRKLETNSDIEYNHRIVPILIIGVSLFAFVATTLPRQEIKANLPVVELYTIELNKEEIFTNRIEPARSLSGDLKSNMVDSLFFLEFHIDNHDLLAEVKIYEIDERNTMIEFVSVASYTVTGGLFTGFDEDKIEEMKELRRDDFKDQFKRGVVEKIGSKNRPESPLYIYYWNPKLDPIILERN